MEEKVIELLNYYGRAVDGETLVNNLIDENNDEEAVMKSLDEMIAAGRLIVTKKNKIILPEQAGLIYGTLQATKSGAMFFIPDDGSDDMIVDMTISLGAMNKDKVWVRRIEQRYGKGHDVCEIAHIAKRANKYVVGTFESDGFGGGYVIPDDFKIDEDIVISSANVKGAEHNDKVVVRIIDYPNGRRPMTGAISEIIGKKGEKGVDILSIAKRMNLPDTFSKASESMARELNRPLTNDDIKGRVNLKNELIITIDGEDAKDLDDAVSLKINGNGNFVLGVHIADVSNYVTEKSPLDIDAYKRGTSVYLVDRVIPMLPKDISNGICSLNEHTDKLTLSCIMEIDKQGNVVAHSIIETVINSAHRMTYTNVNKIFDGDADVTKKYSDITEMLSNMHSLMKILKAKRVRKGSIDFDLPEAEITLDENGFPVSVEARTRGDAEKMIEEFMLIANETVATHMSDMGLPFIYRVHETPDDTKLKTLFDLMRILGYNIKSVKHITPKFVQGILDEIKDTDEESIISRIALRSMKKARYAEECLGHFGLAFEYYCHFTSPIRRYPDLLGHRIIKEMLHGKLDSKRIDTYNASLNEMANHLSECEINAMDAEREVDRIKSCEYMTKHIGEEFTGIISGVANFGIFVELENTIEGMVPLQSISGDYYVYDEKMFRVVGKNTGTIFMMGDEVTVRVEECKVDVGEIEFTLAGENANTRRRAFVRQGSGRHSDKKHTHNDRKNSSKNKYHHSDKSHKKNNDRKSHKKHR